MDNKNNKHAIIKQIVAVFFIQASSTIAFAVFYSGLSIFLTQNKHYSQESAALVTGLFLSLNYLLPLIGGIIAERITSYKNIYYIGAVASVIGCLVLAYTSYLYLGLALFLMSSVSNVCLNMFITSLFSSEQYMERRVAFTWNYIGMNLGFMLGYLFAGFSTISNSYDYLFILMSLVIVAALFLTGFFIKEPTVTTALKYRSKFTNITLCMLAYILLISVITLLFDNVKQSQGGLIFIWILTLICIFYFSFKRTNISDRYNIITFLSFALLSILFWTFYLLSPIAIMQFTQHLVDREIFGFSIAPQWISNVNSFVILLVSPLFTIILTAGRKSNAFFSKTINYFSVGLLFACLSFGILYFGLNFYIHDTHDKLPLWIVLGYLILLAIGEIFISPVSYALIGELIQKPLRGVMTGVWGMNIGIAGLLSSILASHCIVPYINNNGIGLQNILQLQKTFLLIAVFLLISSLTIYFLSKKTRSISHEYHHAFDESSS